MYKRQVYQESQGAIDAHKAPAGADAEYYETERSQRAGPEATMDDTAMSAKRQRDEDDYADAAAHDSSDAKNPRTEE